MDFYIRIQNGRPVDHPIAVDNMRSPYPNVDLDNLPNDWAGFVRLPPPSKLGPYEIAECTYEWDGDIVTDVWHRIPMSEDEKRLKQERVQKNWRLDGGPENWIFDEARCCFVPPKPMPQDGKDYIWIQTANNWVEVEPVIIDNNRPPYPTDGKIYDYDEANNRWIERK